MTILTDADNVTRIITADGYFEDNATSFFSLRAYSHFVEITEKALQKAIHLLEANPRFLQVGEDDITNMICVAMRMAGINVEHDSMEGGHADLVVKNVRYKWLAEAKIKDDSYDYGWLWDGFMQLTERYATNTAGNNRAGFLVYIKQPNSKRVMKRWQDRMSEAEGYRFSFADSDFPLSFKSTHEHTRSGENCDVTHFSLSAYFQPVV
ncbi:MULTISPECIES: hypothetical protein [Pseudomonas]|uniref:PD-(D/E)XK nuclease superfamily protein n=3 Tax=Pseudomonas syringae group TaxID=136849 RepID=A0AB37ZHP7_PSESX|nr:MULTISPECIES: hypothetical protein [Pseudomonas]AVB13410.1 hypothetical protein BKM19_007185 [Pseudomonas amygdali pv. morsprunorum]KWS51271.1 hypothetical protein AL056_12020 [Pseudomonas amygdali pv. morsprunorum]KWS69718.1 hypothetical protein AL054_18435 [Pseudomonas amygdali pv. morsprunorum]MBD1107295.1 hypothetical protein [Pseudomonas amygdali pv. morsprunorum]MBI6668370.1 hypothetical protein [Pseudomonas syringae]